MAVLCNMDAFNDQLNASAKAYLREYCSPERTRDFAVLLDGPWGSGKTYFIKRFLEAHPKHLYVSLYGMTDVRQITEEFYRQLHPILSSKGMRVLGTLGKAALKGTLRLDFDGDGKDDGTVSVGLPDIDLVSGLSDPRERLLVFDDLERCSMKISVVLGYINAFVEHDGLKAIIIANEPEIISRKDEDYIRIKEKLIGQTLRMSAHVNEAFNAFLINISDKNTRAFLSDNRANVIGVHKQSGTNNLRIFKQALWDYERVAQHFTDEHWQNEPAMQSLLSVIVSLSIEHRAGHIQDKQQIARLTDQVARFMKRRRSDGETPTLEDSIDNRYQLIDFSDPVIDSSVIADAVLNGHVDKATLLHALAASKHFARAGERPLWQRAWDIYDLTDEEAEAMAAKFIGAFERRVFRERGEILHALGILLNYAELGLITLSRADVLGAYKGYVDELSQLNALPHWPGPHSVADYETSYDGFGFIEKSSSEFNEGRDYLETKMQEAEAAKYPEAARRLLDQLSEGSQDYTLDLCFNDARPSRFWNVPVLAELPPKEFVERVLQVSPDLQRRAIDTLNLRYRHGRLEGELRKERPWAEEVRNLLKEKATKARRLTSDRLNFLVDRKLDPVLGTA